MLLLYWRHRISLMIGMANGGDAQRGEKVLHHFSGDALD
jgi:hypothetical protein